ncbi:hypothetical protein [Amycolatopsis thermoflava]|nr:hypothetical protein [Amycolatopsis thermoflava]
MLRAGVGYGPSGEGHLRFSFAADIPQIEKAIDRMTACLASSACTRS